MPSDLSPTEKEDREVERLIDKEPAPSRKYRERRGPKHDNRRRRMKVEDPDVNGGDPDMSLNRKTQGMVLRAAARIVSAASVEDLESAISKFEGELRDVSPTLADEFARYAQDYHVEWAKEGWADESSMQKDIDEIRGMSSRFQDVRKNMAHSLRRADADDMVRAVAQAWPSGKSAGWAEKAGILSAIESAIDKVPLPRAYKSPFLRGSPADSLRDKKLLRKLIETAGQTYSMRNVEEEAILHFAQLAAAYRLLQQNPSSVDEASLKDGMDELADKLREQSEELVELGSILEAWNYVGSQFADHGRAKRPTIESVKDYNRILYDLDSFFSSDREVVDQDALMSELADYSKSRFGDLPPELEGAFEGYSRAAASNEGLQSGAMSQRTATFHGVDDRRGNPVQPPNTGYKSFHSRNFTEENYKAILAYAEALLDQPWLKYNWDGAPKDSQFRAALDLAIHMADDCLYQSKIDADTYNLLYNRLARAGHDSFSETVIPVQDKVGQKRRAAMRNRQGYRNIVKVASDLRGTHPAISLQILKNLRALISSDAPVADDISSHVALEETSADPAVSMDSLAKCGEEGASMIESEKPDRTGQSMIESEKAGQTMSEKSGQTMIESEKAGPGEAVGQGPGDDISFRSMGDEDFEKLKKDLKREVDKLFTEDDVEKFIEGFDDIIQEVEKKTAATLGSAVPLAVLLRAAASSEAAKRVLGPIIVAAKKKKDAKKGKKGKEPEKSEKKSDKSDAPFGVKKAPPFGKGKKGKGKKRKAHLTKDDISW